MEAEAKKKVKYEVNMLALALIVYTLAANAIVTIDLLIRVFLNRAMHNDFTESLLIAMPDSAWSEILAAAFGIFLIWLFSRSRVGFTDIFRQKKRMSFPVFMEVLCVFGAFQLVAVWLDDLLEYCLNMIGFTLTDSIEMATANSSNISQLIYACVMAPLSEELIYRGFCLRRMQFKGNVFAIVLSALLFGIMHANLAQMLFAFLVGLVLGFVAVEYSVVYAIILHVINNFVFGDLLSYVYGGAPDDLYTLVFYFLFVVFFICGALVLLSRRKEIASYIRANRPEKGTYRAAIFAVLMLVFLVMNVALSILLISPLSS